MGAFETGRLDVITAALLDCTAAELAGTPGGIPPWRAVVTGAEVIPEACHCGQLAIHVPLLYQSDSFPEPLARPHGSCDAKYTVAEIVVTVLRCQPQPDDQGRPPLASEMAAAAAIDFADRQAMMKAAKCCALPLNLLGQHLAVGETGMCAGSALHIFVAMSNCEDC